MSVRRDSRDGTWRYRIKIKLPNGKTPRISGTPQINTKVAAEIAEREHIQRMLSPPSPEASQKKEVPNFSKFVDEQWLPTYPAAAGNRPTSVREKEIHIRCHLKPALGRFSLDRIQGEVVDRFFADLRKPRPSGKKTKRERTLSAKSIKNVRATLRRILASACEWGYIDRIPHLPKVKVADKGWDFFTREEATKLVATARDEEERVLLLFALDTGARAGEQLALEWGDIDWHNNLVVFRRSSTRGEIGPTKSGRERKVPMTERLATALRRHKHLRGKLVFCRADGKPFTLWQLHERLWGTCRRAGLREIRWHDLRHSFASQLVSAGVPLRQVQDWLGHSTMMMTMRYSHLAPGQGATLIRALENPSAVATGWQQNP
jgi:integrase